MKKPFTISIEEDLHKKFKLFSLVNGKTMSEFVEIYMQRCVDEQYQAAPPSEITYEKDIVFKK